MCAKNKPLDSDSVWIVVDYKQENEIIMCVKTYTRDAVEATLFAGDTAT